MPLQSKMPSFADEAPAGSPFAGGSSSARRRSTKGPTAAQVAGGRPEGRRCGVCAASAAVLGGTALAAVLALAATGQSGKGVLAGLAGSAAPARALSAADATAGSDATTPATWALSAAEAAVSTVDAAADLVSWVVYNKPAAAVADSDTTGPLKTTDAAADSDTIGPDAAEPDAPELPSCKAGGGPAGCRAMGPDPTGPATDADAAATSPSAATRVLSAVDAAVEWSRGNGNPFQGHPFYVNPSYKASLETSIATAFGNVKHTLESMREVPSAYWLDTKGKISGAGTGTMEGILADAAAKSPPQLVVFIVYDLPNRDCHAKASNGEICCHYKADRTCDYDAGGDCAAGIAEYKAEYINPIAKVLSRYNGRVPIVLIVEPDSLPNLSTNQADPRCGNEATKRAYKDGITYAVQTLAGAASAAAMYLDAGHGGWLGWKNNMKDYVETIKSLGLAQHLRGFATNTAGYQALGKMCPEYDYCLNNAHPDHPCCYDPCGLTAQWNPSHNELNYVLHLRKAFSEGIPGFLPHMIVDTGRGGVADMRRKCANWCNIRGAGVGHVPTTATADPSVLDAYFWLKTPGESDGCTEKMPDGRRCPRYDTDCGSEDSLGGSGTHASSEPSAPEAGAWFDYQVKMLAANARMS